MQHRTIAQQPIATSIELNQIIKQFQNPEGLTLLGSFVFLILLASFGGGKKGKISTGRVVGMAEKLSDGALAKAAAEQIATINKIMLRIASSY